MIVRLFCELVNKMLSVNMFLRLHTHHNRVVVFIVVVAVVVAVVVVVVVVVVFVVVVTVLACSCPYQRPYWLYVRDQATNVRIPFILTIY